MQSREKFGSAWYSKPGLLYFIAAGSPPVAIKIGVANRNGFMNRFRGIQGSNHEFVELLGVICFETGEKPMLQAERKERELHEQFAHLQRLKNGHVGHEWFTVSPELMAYIEQHTLPPEKCKLQRHVSIRVQPKAP
jgi:hypothetical protein